jgi:hypothetical protein
MAADRASDGNMACQLRMDVRDGSGKHLFPRCTCPPYFASG